MTFREVIETTTFVTPVLYFNPGKALLHLDTLNQSLQATDSTYKVKIPTPNKILLGAIATAINHTMALLLTHHLTTISPDTVTNNLTLDLRDENTPAIPNQPCLPHVDLYVISATNNAPAPTAVGDILVPCKNPHYSDSRDLYYTYSDPSIPINTNSPPGKYVILSLSDIAQNPAIIANIWPDIINGKTN